MSAQAAGSDVVSPFDGWPRTIRTRKADGAPCLTLEAHLLSPERAKVGDALLVALGFGGWAVILVPYFTSDLSGRDPGAALLIWFGVIVVLYALRPWWLGRRLLVEMTPERMTIGRKRYDRNLVEAFAASEIHERAREEEIKDIEAQQDAAMRGRRPKRRTKYYRKSHHLVMRYGGQRVDIASIYGRPEIGARLRDRLDSMNEMMDAAQNYGPEAVEEAPEHRYGARPGVG